MKYFIVENNRQEGPFSIYELKDKGIGSEVLVWAEGMADWTPAWKVEELKAFLFDTKDSSVPPPVPPTTEGHETTSASGRQQPKSGGCLKRGLVVAVFMLAALLVAMAISCPSEQQHKAVIKERIVLALEQSAGHNQNLFGVGVAMVRHLLSDEMLDAMLDDLVDYHNYVIFSRTTIHTDGKDRSISFGGFGKVFTMNEDDLSRYIDQHNPLEALPETAASPAGKGGSLRNTIEEELIGSLGRIVKKQIGENADSSTTEALEKIVDGVTDMLKQQIDAE